MDGENETIIASESDNLDERGIIGDALTKIGGVVKKYVNDKVR